MSFIRSKSRFSRLHLSIFLIIFAVLGLVLLIKSLAAPNPNLPGDLNNDNTVNVTDLSILLTNYGTTNSTADINTDGTVNILDLSILLSHYGESTGNSTYPPKFRYIYDSSSDPSGAEANGWNILDCGSRSCADSTPAGTQGMVWLGDYDNTSCSWQQSDTAVQNAIQAAKGDPKVFGWFISDEPNPYACPNAPSQHKARTDLIHSIDPNTKVFEVLDTNGFNGQFTVDAYQQFPLWAGTADYIGIDPYPCTNTGCNFTFMDNVIAAADSAGLPYWGISQAFDGTACGEYSWPWPSAANLAAMLDKWKTSHEVGYGTFAWNWSSCGSDLSARPDLLNVLKSFNSGTL